MKKFKKVLSVLFMAMVVLSLTACGESNQNKEKEEIIHYGDAESFEAALNNGENLEGKIVQFIAGELRPNSTFGYNIWAGEHLNFVSSKNPDVKQGDTVVVRATTIESVLGSWIIKYEKVDHGVIDDTTILYSEADGSDLNGDTSEASGYASSFAVDNSRVSAQPLELVDCGCCINPPSGDSAYVDFCGMIYNPNEKLIAEYPKVVVTVKNGDGSIVATDEQVGGIVMPKDTITLCGMFSMPISDLTDDAQIIFTGEWKELGNETSFYSLAKTTDFAITNVTERNSDNGSFITGEIANNYSENIDRVKISMILRKDSEIVYMEETFLDNLGTGRTKAFQFHRYGGWPEHDTIDISAMAW